MYTSACTHTYSYIQKKSQIIHSLISVFSITQSYTQTYNEEEVWVAYLKRVSSFNKATVIEIYSLFNWERNSLESVFLKKTLYLALFLFISLWKYTQRKEWKEELCCKMSHNDNETKRCYMLGKQHNLRKVEGLNSWWKWNGWHMTLNIHKLIFYHIFANVINTCVTRWQSFSLIRVINVTFNFPVPASFSRIFHRNN